MKKKNLTLDEIADLYDKHNGGRPARTLRIVDVYKWAVNQPELIEVHNDSTLSLIQEQSA